MGISVRLHTPPGERGWILPTSPETHPARNGCDNTYEFFTTHGDLNSQGIAAIIASISSLLGVILPTLRVLFTRIRDTHEKTEQIENNLEILLIRTDRIMDEIRKGKDGKHGKKTW